MNDERIWEFERELWLGGGDVYREKVSQDCVMGLPQQPFLFDHEAATRAVESTPVWSEVEFADTRVTRHDEGLIVIGYRAHAKREGSDYHAVCTSTLLRLEHENWVVIQHQQTPFGIEVKDPDAA